MFSWCTQATAAAAEAAKKLKTADATIAKLQVAKQTLDFDRKKLESDVDGLRKQQAEREREHAAKIALYEAELAKLRSQLRGTASAAEESGGCFADATPFVASPQLCANADDSERSVVVADSKKKKKKKNNKATLNAPPTKKRVVMAIDDSAAAVAIGSVAPTIGRFVIVPASQNKSSNDAAQRRRNNDLVVAALVDLGLLQVTKFPDKNDGSVRLIVTPAHADFMQVMKLYCVPIMKLGCHVITLDALLALLDANGNIVDDRDDVSGEMTASEALDFIKSHCVPPRSARRIATVSFSGTPQRFVDQELGGIWSVLRASFGRDRPSNASRNVGDDDGIYIKAHTPEELREALRIECRFAPPPPGSRVYAGVDDDESE